MKFILLIFMMTSFSMAHASKWFWDNNMFMIIPQNSLELHTHFGELKNKSKEELITIAKETYPTVLEWLTKLDAEMGKRLEKEELIDALEKTPEEKLKKLIENEYLANDFKPQFGGSASSTLRFNKELVLLYPTPYIRKFFRCAKLKSFECSSVGSNMPTSLYWPILD